MKENHRILRVKKERRILMKNKLVICDIDGTLVVKHQSLSPRAKAVIKTLRERGILFGIASGRSVEQEKRMMKSWGFDDFAVLIAMNGCTIWDGMDHKQYEQFFMKKEWIKEIVAFMEHYPTINTLMYKDDKIIYAKEEDSVHESSKSSDMEEVMVASMEEFYATDAEKIMFRVDEHTMQELEQYFAHHPHDYYQAVKTQSTMLEFCHRSVSKACALKQFCRLHDIDLADVIAFGDTTNDNEMLMISGWGVCMADGSDDTKAIADALSDKPCDEDGWADYMERHVLPLID